MNQYEIETAKQQNGVWTVKVWEQKERRERVHLYTTEPSKVHNTEEEAREEGQRFLALHEKGKPYTVFQDHLHNTQSR